MGRDEADGAPAAPDPPPAPGIRPTSKVDAQGEVAAPAAAGGATHSESVAPGEDAFAPTGEHGFAEPPTEFTASRAGPEPVEGTEQAITIEAHFANPRRQKPQRYNRGRSKVHPTTPLDPIRPYMAGPVPRRRKSEWPTLILVMVATAIVMAVVCMAGFAIFRSYGPNF